MPFSITRLPDPPALLFVQRGGGVTAETEAVLGSLIGALDRQPEPIFLILDFRHLAISLDELTSFANAAAKRPGALLHHPNLRESLVISDDMMIVVAVSGLGSPSFGSVRIRTFPTPEDVIAYCRGLTADTAAAGGPANIMK